MAEPKPRAPRMPPGYGAPQDASGADRLPWRRAEERLESARNYWLCTTRANGRPHTAPVWGLWRDGELWFSTDPASIKGRNLARDTWAVVDLESGDDVVVLEGDVLRVDWAEPIVDAYEAKYAFRLDPANESHGAYVLRPRSAQTWTERGYPNDATRWEFGD